MYYITEKSPFEIRWHINIVNSSVSLADAKLLLVLKTVRGNYDITDYIEDIVDNVIRVKLASLTFVGDYSLYLKIQSDSFEEVSLLERLAFRVVKDNDPSVTVDVVELSSDIYVKSYAYDSALSSGSTNAVQNAVITEALADKQETINDLEDIRSGANKGATALQDVPEEYITETELALLLNNKVDKEEGKGLSTNDYTTAEKNKLASLENYDDSGLLTKLTQLENAKASKEDVEELVEELEINAVLIEDLQNTKIDKEADDYYPQLSVGTADNLSGVDEVDSEFSFRRSGGGAIADGVARVQSIKGNSVVWNQTFSGGLAGNNASVENVDNGAVITAEAATFINAYISFSFIPNHKYLYSTIATLPYADTVVIGTETNGNAQYRQLVGGANTPTAIEGIVSCVSPAATFYIFPNWNVAASVGDSFKFEGVKIVDLTKMFGAGNEPTTIEEYNARKPIVEDECAYNEGEVIHMTAEGIKSVGRNIFNEEWELGGLDNNGQIVNEVDNVRSLFIRLIGGKTYYFNLTDNNSYIKAFAYDENYNLVSIVADMAAISPTKHFLFPSNATYMRFRVYKTDGITIATAPKIMLGIYDGEYLDYEPYTENAEDLSIVANNFPNGMRSAGAAHDEIRYNKASNRWEKVVRVGEVDLGELNWNYSQGVFITYIKDIKGIDGANEAMMSKYNIAKSVYGEDMYNNVEDKVFKTNGGAVGGSKSLAISDSAYTDAASFKAAMSGVMLYYELAKPIVTEIKEKDFNLDYKVWNCGTEQMVASKPSSALSANITYGFNAVGLIKQLRSMLQALSAKVANL